MHLWLSIALNLICYAELVKSCLYQINRMLAFLCVTLMTAGWSSTYAQVSLQRYFCSPLATEVEQINAPRDCTSSSDTEIEPAQSDGHARQFIWVKVTNTLASSVQRELVVSPYYLAELALYAPTPTGWRAIARGGALLGGDKPSSRLGGHHFAVTVQPGVNDWLLEIVAPSFAHRWIALQDPMAGLVSQELLLAVHLGVLAAVSAMMAGALIWRPTPLQAGALMLSLLVLTSVLIGSGAVYQLSPTLPVYWVSVVIFNLSVASRVAVQTWIYAKLIAPHSSHRRLFERLNLGVYVASAVTMLLFGLGQALLGWLLVVLLLYASLFLQAWGVYTAKTMPKVLRLTLAVSVATFLVADTLAIVLMLLDSGHSNLPVYVSRFLDLALPMAMLVAILVRNATSDSELMRAKDELMARENTLELERRIREDKHVLLDMLTHEIKNPLAAINFATNVLSKQVPQDARQAQNRIANIERSVAAIDQIIEHCRMSNNLEEGRIQAERRAFDLPSWIKPLIDEDPRFKLHLPAMPTVRGDPYLLHVVLSNLLDNAVKYSPAFSAITVETFERTNDGNRIWGFRVINSVDADLTPDAQRMFDRYYRHENAQGKRGAGLGLTLCQEICKLLGGEIRCRIDGQQVSMEVCIEQP